MYKDKDKQKQYNRERMQRIRQGNTNGGNTEQGNTSEGITLTESEYPPILRALVDPIKREKLERITQELKARHVAGSVRYGIDGPTFDSIGDLLDCVTL